LLLIYIFIWTYILVQSAHRKALDILNTVGISNSVLRLIERRNRVDQWIKYAGMLLTVIFLLAFIMWRHWSFSDVETLKFLFMREHMKVKYKVYFGWNAKPKQLVHHEVKHSCVYKSCYCYTIVTWLKTYIFGYFWFAVFAFIFHIKVQTKEMLDKSSFDFIINCNF